ncbi:hypothetical protein BDW22DRAFT_171914 [Trametopsis cervina]|nr:hypothetical protein BDW22DRAFT_171914 [Trametopsis cervina]
MTNPASGVVYSAPDGTLKQLPLEKVVIDAVIIDLSARVDVVQRFYNVSVSATSRAKYIFPVPANAAICGFEMRTADGRVIIGEAMEKSRAHREHNDALGEGKKTALLDWVTDDMFVISIGSVPGKESVTIITTYVMDLLRDDVETQVRFYVPMSVGQRYGQTPAGAEDASAPTTLTRVRFNIGIQMFGYIISVESPSHAEMQVQPYKTHFGRPSKHRQHVKLRSKEYLTQDFVLLVHAAKLDRPRCFAEYSTNGTNSIAMQLTLIPKFDIPPLPAQEYLFLVDRSDSMGGLRIDIAKRALVMLSRSLPPVGTTWNVLSFGSTWTRHWAHSQSYNNQTLLDMTRHINSMEADYGGTEIRQALASTFNSRNTNTATAVFILTDGESTDIDATRSLVARAVAQSRKDAPLRVFSLAIGERSSSAMCQAISEAGNGECLYATRAENIGNKLASLVRAGRTYTLKNATLDWGLPSHPLQTGRPVRSFRQFPSVIPPLYPGVRLKVFALIEGDGFKPPAVVTLRAQRDGTGEVLEFKIPVEQAKFETENVGVPLIHTLAARAIISELQAAIVTGVGAPEGLARASVISLAEQYQLVSRFTSFVLVEDVDDPDLDHPRFAQSLQALRHRRISEKLALHDIQPQSNRLHNTAFFQSVMRYVSAFGSALGQTWFRYPPLLNSVSLNPGPRSHPMPGHGNENDDSDDAQEGGPGATHIDDGDDPEWESEGSFTTISSLLSSTSSLSDWDESRTSSFLDQDARSPSPAVNLAEPTSDPPLRPLTPLPEPLAPEVFELITGMGYDGSFSRSSQLETIVGRAAIEEGLKLQVDETLWTTALSVAFLQGQMQSTSNYRMLESFLEKALEYGHRVLRAPGSPSFRELVEKAKTVLQLAPAP